MNGEKLLYAFLSLSGIYSCATALSYVNNDNNDNNNNNLYLTRITY